MDDKLSIEQKSLLVDVVSNELARLIYKRSIMRYATGSTVRTLSDEVELKIKLLNEILNVI